MSDPLPHLSHSRINKYLLCPEQYRLYYVENLRPRHPSASLVFGQTMHGALARLFQTGEDPVQWFLQAWEEIRETELTYGKRDSWERLRDSGEGLLAKFVAEELRKIQSVEAIERPFHLDIAGLELPFVGIIDLVADVEGARMVVDFKTSGSSYGEHEAALSDQLTAYELAEPEVQKAALCVLVKTKDPKIEWHVVERWPKDFTEYLAKAEFVAREVQAGRFYKRPGAWCAWCDYLPVCLGDKGKAEKTLMRL
jgi:hypothetical protein